MARFTVIGGPSSEDLAKKISVKLKTKYLRSELRIFPDGESKITVRGRPSDGSIIVVQSTYPPVDSNLIRALFLISKARQYSSDVIAVVPYIGYARQDKVFLSGEVVSISVIASLFKTAGATNIITVDSHSKIALRYFKIPVKNISAIPLLASYFRKLNLKEPLVVSPDLFWSSSAKEFARHLGTKSIALHKQRDRKTGKLKIKPMKIQNVRGRDIILVDDMVSSGNTIIQAAKFLKKQNCGKIFVACTHGVLVSDAERKIKAAGISKIVSTNTIPGKTGIVDVSEIIANAISDIGTG